MWLTYQVLAVLICEGQLLLDLLGRFGRLTSLPSFTSRLPPLHLGQILFVALVFVGQTHGTRVRAPLAQTRQRRCVLQQLLLRLARDDPAAQSLQCGGHGEWRNESRSIAHQTKLQAVERENKDSGRSSQGGRRAID